MKVSYCVCEYLGSSVDSDESFQVTKITQSKFFTSNPDMNKHIIAEEHSAGNDSKEGKI